MKKLLLLSVFAAGYVVGAKAGRERYEQIRSGFLKVKNDPHVQEAASEAVGIAKEVGVGITDKVVDKVTPDVEDGDLRPHGTTVPADPFAARI